MKNSTRRNNIIAIVVIVVLAIILIPVLIVNLTLIVKGNVNRDVPPDIFGIAPLAVTTGSMSGTEKDSFDEGALIFVKILDDEEKQQLQIGDIVCFKTSDGVYVTHRIVAMTPGEAGTVVSFTTKGDANNATDGNILPADILGKCVGSAAGLGGFAMFLQTPAGIIVFVGIPVALFILYDIIRITYYNKKVKAAEETDRDEELRDKDEEIRRLRALVEQQGKNPESAPEEPSEERKED